MRLAISNIAWNPSEDSDVVSLLKKHSVDAIDIAPGKYFPTPSLASSRDVKQVKKWWANQGIEITGMQALLFGTVGLNVFGPASTREDMLTHLDHVCRIGSELGARRIVFGSPKNRDRRDLIDAQVKETYMEFFTRLGAIADGYDVTICLEPNPAHYGANFMRNSDETAEVVLAVNHPAIKMQFDTGSILINGENAEQVLSDYSHTIDHIHISEPDLLPVGDLGTNHAAIATAIQKHLPHRIATIEMLATTDEPHTVALDRALAYTNEIYRT